MDTIWIYSLNLGIVALMMVIGWLVSLKLENVTVVDSLWAVGFMLIAWSSLMLGPGGTLRSLLLVLMTTAWGLRLSGYLSWRNWGKGEDPRYGTWRARHGEHFGKVSLYKVFLLQAVFLWVIALSSAVRHPGFGAGRSYLARRAGHCNLDHRIRFRSYRRLPAGAL